MRCPACGATVEEGNRFCMNCGQEIGTASETIVVEEREDELPSENIYGVFKKVVAKPSQSSHLSPNHFVFGLLSIAIYSLIVAIYIYYSMNSLSSNLQKSFDDLGLGGVLGESVEVSIFDYLILPFLGFFALQIIMILLIFIVSRITGEMKDLRTLTAQYGGYLFPFSFIFILGIIFAVLNFTWLAAVTFIIATVGVIFMMPALLTRHGIENKGGGTDRVYLLLIVYFIGALLLTFVTRSYIEAMISSFMGSFMNLF